MIPVARIPLAAKTACVNRKMADAKVMEPDTSCCLGETPRAKSAGRLKITEEIYSEANLGCSLFSIKTRKEVITMNIKGIISMHLSDTTWTDAAQQDMGCNDGEVNDPGDGCNGGGEINDPCNNCDAL